MPDFPVFSIRPVLEHYGFEGIQDDRPNHMVRCAFHGERSASCSVDTVQQVYKCHGCGRQGGAIKVIMEEEGLDYAGAIKRAQEISGESHSPVRGTPRGGGRVSRRSGTSSSGRAFKRSGGREGPTSGTRGSRG